MLTLEWIGKNKVVNHHQEVPFRVLERQYSFGEQRQHTENNDSENMIIHGDNLEALKALLPQYEGKVKCIYIAVSYTHLAETNPEFAVNVTALEKAQPKDLEASEIDVRLGATSVSYTHLQEAGKGTGQKNQAHSARPSGLQRVPVPS